VDRNWRSRRRPGVDIERVGGEIDLVVSKGATLVFCEVKTRRSGRFGEPFEAVTSTKQVRIRRLAAQWLRERGSSLAKRPAEIRFDVVSILDGSVAVLEGAF
jgi:putative endonuclease